MPFPKGLSEKYSLIIPSLFLKKPRQNAPHFAGFERNLFGNRGFRTTLFVEFFRIGVDVFFCD
jgi:hypothetical protein